ncbi:MAG TPA: hypothetical protein VL860_00825, partial [Planctomycetota bacterium]|nr:hypothetical protein [Planctomycetota bacterium]
QLPVRRDYPLSLAAVDTEIAALETRIAQEKTTPGKKRILDRLELLHFYKLKAFYHFTGCSEEKLQPNMLMNQPLPIIQLGPVVIAGLPGEPFNEYSARLRAETLGDNLIVCDQANGYVGYVPTAAQVPLGSYGVNYSLFDERAEPILFAGIKAGLKQLQAR